MFVVGVHVVDDRSGRTQPASALSDVAEELGDKPEPHPLASESWPVEAIVEFINDERCDLVVVGKAGRGALGRALVGSTTTSLPRPPPVPVMIVPPV